METKRVFIGMPADLALRSAAAGFRRDHDDLQVRWISPENLHVTLVPPWESDDPGTVCCALEEIAAGCSAIPVRFDVVSPGPDPGSPRLLWATGMAPVALSRLFITLRRRFGDGKEADREMLLHLTLARFDRQRGRTMPSPTLHGQVEWTGVLDELRLYESVLKPSGAEYRVLCRAPLDRA
ncbi:MAG TPA: 2'-5' RNA ligase family protein [Chlorobaculum sp.]|nr:2'-5' RNA ligase family protein [Chlorobaculum sp.]